MGENLGFLEIVTRGKNNTLPPLFVAARDGLPRRAYFLLYTCHVDVNEVCCQMTALDIAIQCGHVSVVELLLSHPNISTRRLTYYSPLHNVMSLPRSDNFGTILHLLLDHSATDINELDDEGNTPLMTACLWGNLEGSLRLLCEKNLNTDQSNCVGATASHIACHCGNVAIVTLLIKRGIFQHFTEDRLDLRPICVACREGQINVVKCLFKFASNAYFGYARNFRKFYPGMMLASLNGHVRILKLLISNFDTGKEYTRTLLIKCMHKAISHNNVKAAVELIHTLSDKNDRTLLPVILCTLERDIWSPHKRITKELFSIWLDLAKHNWNANVVMDNIYSMYARTSLDTDIYEDFELYMLYHAILYGMPDLVKLLLDRCTNVTREMIHGKLKSKGISLLNLSAQNVDIMNCLLKQSGELPASTKNNLGSFISWYKKEEIIDYSVPLNDSTQIPLYKVVHFICFIHSINQYKVKLLDIVRLLIENEAVEQEEKSLIFQTIKSFIETVSLEIAKTNKLFQYRPLRVGSSREGTRPFRSDEFDFILLCLHIQSFLDITVMELEPSNVCVKVKPDCCQLQEYTMENRYFNVLKFKTHMDIIFKQAALRVLDNGAFTDFLFIDPSFFEIKPISCIHLNWRGLHYKDMEIKIDLVPAFRIENYNFPKKYTHQTCEHYVFCRNTRVDTLETVFPVAFSNVELTLIQSMPDSARNGLKLAKGMRISTLFPSEIMRQIQDVYSIEDCAKTYMLKMSLIYCHAVVRSKWSRDLLPEQWAFLVYRNLEKRLLTTGIIESVFSLTPESFLFKCSHPLYIDLQLEGKCCINRKNLLLITGYLGLLLKSYLRYHGRYDDDLETLAEKISLTALDTP